MFLFSFSSFYLSEFESRSRLLSPFLFLVHVLVAATDPEFVPFRLPCGPVAHFVQDVTFSQSFSRRFSLSPVELSLGLCRRSRRLHGFAFFFLFFFLF